MAAGRRVAVCPVSPVIAPAWLLLAASSSTRLTSASAASPSTPSPLTTGVAQPLKSRASSGFCAPSSALKPIASASRARASKLSAVAIALPASVLHAIEKAERATAAGRRLHLCVAIDYSSRDAIARAAAFAASQLDPANPRSPDSLAATLNRSLTAHRRRSRLADPHRRRTTPLRLSPLGMRLCRALFRPLYVA